MNHPISRRTAIATLGALSAGAVLAQGVAPRPVTVRFGYQKSSTLTALLKAQARSKSNSHRSTPL